MAEQNRTTLKNYFQTGDRPSQAQYADLIDSQLNLAETGTQVMVGILSSSGLKVSGDITASNNISIGGRTSTVDLTVSSLGSTQIPFIQAGSDGIFNGSGLFTFLGGTLSVPNITQVTTANIETTGNGHITASGNISSSNTVLGLTGSFERLDATTSSISILESTNINVTGNITASGVVEASTGIFGTNTTTIDDNINTTGNLTVNNSLLNISNGNIIASGIVSASGITTTALTIAGAIFGQSTDTFWASGSSGQIYYNGGNVGIGTTNPQEKLHVFGNISASGTVKALDYMISGRKFANVSSTDSVGIELGNAGNGNLLLTHLTASGNINASGILTAEGLVISDDATITDDLTVNGDIDLEGSIDVNGTTNLDVVDIDGAVDMASTLVVGSHITASGNISSSAKITALSASFSELSGNSPLIINSTQTTIKKNITFEDDINIFHNAPILNQDDNNVVQANANDTTFGSDLVPTKIDGNITASGNISSSGTIVGSNLSGTNTGDQDLSGFLSSSAQIASDISGSIVATSSSFASRIAANEIVTAKTLISSSAQLSLSGTNTGDQDLSGFLSSSAQIATEISGAFTAASSSFSTRVTANDAKVSYTDAAVTSVINAAGILSSSAQIAIPISGAFTAASSSFSTRVTANDAKVSYTDAAVTSVINTAGVISSSKQIATEISGALSTTAIAALGDITSSGNISASGKITGLTGSFGRLEGLSPITFGDDVIVNGNITASNHTISALGIIGNGFVAVPSESQMILNHGAPNADYIYKSEPQGIIGVNNEHAGTVNGHMALYAPNSSIRMAFSPSDVSGPINGASQSFATSASLSAIRFQNLPTSKEQAAQIGTGSLWLSGSADDGTSKFLLVYTG